MATFWENASLGPKKECFYVSTDKETLDDYQVPLFYFFSFYVFLFGT